MASPPKVPPRSEQRLVPPWWTVLFPLAVVLGAAGWRSPVAKATSTATPATAKGMTSRWIRMEFLPWLQEQSPGGHHNDAARPGRTVKDA